MLTGPDICRYIELAGETTPLTVAYRLAIDPEVEGTVNSFKAKSHIALQPGIRHEERPPIAAGRVLRGNVRRINRKGIVDIGIVRIAIAMHLPARGNLQVIPLLDRIGIHVETLGSLSR